MSDRSRPAARTLTFLTALIFCLLAPQARAAIGTQFTYQGQISQSGTPYNGVMDFQFELYDEFGNPVAGPIDRSDVNVTNGLFTVLLDFGSGAFGGDRRFLEIRVSPDYPTTGYTTLSPRQELTPTPYAIWSTNAGFATSANDSANLGGVPASGYSLVGHTHPASSITGIPDGYVVFGDGGGLNGESDFTYDKTTNNLHVLGEIRTDALYRIGTNAVLRVDPPKDNTFVGLAGNGNAMGNANTAVGDGALVSANSVSGGANPAVANNTAVGRNALAATAVAAGDAATVATNNTAIGADALAVNTKGSFNVAVGSSALAANTVAGSSTAVGNKALAANTVGVSNTAMGDSALTTNTNGNANLAIGPAAMQLNTSGSLNTAIGVQALKSNTTASGSVAVGFGALLNNTVGGDNVAVGANALAGNVGTASPNTGWRNTAVGTSSLNLNTFGSDNTGMGALALQRSTGDRNTAMGASAVQGAVGFGGTDNTGIGAYSLNLIGAGNSNTGLGSNSLGKLTNASNNTALGANAFPSLTTGSSNVGVGYAAGQQITTGGNNILIGFNAGNLLTGADNNNIMIGVPGTAGTSGQIRIGANGTHTSAFMGGIFGITTTAGIPVFINANGQLGTVVSSQRFKTDIEDMGDTSDVLLQLRPVVYRYKPGVVDAQSQKIQQYGLIAEEVAKVNPDWVARDAQGQILTVRYDQVNAALLGLVQKQQTEIDKLTRLLQEMDARLAQIERAGTR